MINSISKDKIPKDVGYVLRSSQLDHLLQVNDIAIHTDLNYFSSTGPLLYAYYLLPNDHIPYYRLYIQSGTVLKSDIKTAKVSMSEIVLPEFIRWINTILKLPENSTVFNNSPTFDATFKCGKVEIKTIP